MDTIGSIKIGAGSRMSPETAELVSVLRDCISEMQRAAITGTSPRKFVLNILVPKAYEAIAKAEYGTVDARSTTALKPADQGPFTIPGLPMRRP